MNTAVQIIWIVGLVAALALTVAVLKQAMLLINELRCVARLAEMTRDASRVLAENVQPAPLLSELHQFVPTFHALRSAATLVELMEKLPGFEAKGGKE